MARTFSRKIKRSAIALVIACFALGFIPIRYLAAPQWDVWVKDEAGTPMAGLNVRLTYKHYSAEWESHEITLITDQNGHVAFVSQYRAVSLLQRAFYTTLSALGGEHASFGNHAGVFVSGGDYDGDAMTGPYITDWTGSPNKMTSIIIARRMPFERSAIATAQAPEVQRFVVLPPQLWDRSSYFGSWIPSSAEIQTLEANLSQISRFYESKLIRIEYPDRYFRQYIGVKHNGKRQIFINAFCDDPPPTFWRSRLHVVSDGGSCYWQAFYDPDTKNFSDLTINGEA